MVLYKLSEMTFSENVTIEGFVLNPGEKFQDGMTVFDLLFLGGGFNNSERLKKHFAKSRSFQKS